ncbi:MAG: hypothetical protein ACP5OX_01485 [Minisyncoccia bacterium]
MSESEFQIIKERVKKKEAHEEIKKPEEIVVKEAIGERIEEALRDLPPLMTEKISTLSTTNITKVQIGGDEFQKKVQELVEIAFEKNIPYAVNLARKSGNYSLIDAFHDALVKYFIEKSVSEKEL